MKSSLTPREMTLYINMAAAYLFWSNRYGSRKIIQKRSIRRRFTSRGGGGGGGGGGGVWMGELP